MQVTTIGLDITHVFQVHAIDAAEKVIIRKHCGAARCWSSSRRCRFALSAWKPARAHYWTRELTKLGHQVRLMPAKDVKAYVKRNKSDAADAEAICEAVRRPTMRFVQVKSAEQQSRLMLHRTRDLLMRQRTQLINALRAHMAELGIMAAQGLRDQGTAEDHRGRTGCAVAGRCSRQPCRVGGGASGAADDDWIDQEADRRSSIARTKQAGGSGASWDWHYWREPPSSATVADPMAFRSGRDFAAWIGLVPRQDFDRRQAEARADLETGRPLCAAHSRRWRSRGLALRQAEP